MGHRGIRTALKTLLTAIPNIGVVHEYDRQSVDPDQFVAMFRTTISGSTVVRGWVITEEQINEEELTSGVEAQDLMTHAMVIRGYWQLDDASSSELAFLDMVEQILDKLRADTESNALNGVVVGTSGPGQARRLAYWVLGNLICHYAEISYPAVEMVGR